MLPEAVSGALRRTYLENPSWWWFVCMARYRGFITKSQKIYGSVAPYMYMNDNIFVGGKKKGSKCEFSRGEARNTHGQAQAYAS